MKSTRMPSEQTLHEAAMAGDIDCVKALITAGRTVNVYEVNRSNQPNFFCMMPIHLACISGHHDIVGELLESGSQTSYPTANAKYTPLHYAARCGYLNIVELLIRSGASITEINAAHQTALHVACINGHLDICRYLLQEPLAVSSQLIGMIDNNGFSCIHYACRSGNASLVDLLLQNGADPAVNAADGRTCDILAESPQVRDVLISYQKKRGRSNDIVPMLEDSSGNFSDDVI